MNSGMGAAIIGPFKQGEKFMSVKRLAGLGLMAAFLAAIGSADADGTAKATVTLAEGTFNYSGGTCTPNAGGLVVNIGEHAPSARGARNDYFGASIPKVPGHFENATVSFTRDGKRYSVGAAAGEATATSASFSGSLLRGGGTAKGSFSC